MDYDSLHVAIGEARTIRQSGRVTRVVGLTIESEGPAVSLGHICYIENLESGARVEAEVVGFRDNRLLLMALGDLKGITPGAVVVSLGDHLRTPVGRSLIGRTLNGLGRPIDGLGKLDYGESRSIEAQPISPLSRPCITETILTGIKVIDTMAACGKGQRLEDIHGWILISGGKPARQHYVPVEYRACQIRNRFVHVVPFNQNRVKPGDTAGLCCAGALK